MSSGINYVYDDYVYDDHSRINMVAEEENGYGGLRPHQAQPLSHMR